jgi:hypothetical protein
MNSFPVANWHFVNWGDLLFSSPRNSLLGSGSLDASNADDNLHREPKGRRGQDHDGDQFVGRSGSGWEDDPPG